MQGFLATAEASNPPNRTFSTQNMNFLNCFAGHFFWIRILNSDPEWETLLNPDPKQTLDKWYNF